MVIMEVVTFNNHIIIIKFFMVNMVNIQVVEYIKELMFI